jgi:endonuclease III
MTSRSLAAGSNHEARIKSTEAGATLVDQTRCDVRTFQAALIESAKQCQKVANLLNLDIDGIESLISAFSELERKCMDVVRTLDSLVSRYDRFLNLV